jgi:hypothetical protein
MFAAFALAIVIVVGVIVSRSGKGENAGLWTGTCPAAESDMQRDLAKCWAKHDPLVSCGRTVVSAQTGNNDHYKLGDKLDECWICGEIVRSGVYTKGVDSCVETHWMDSPEFKKIQRALTGQ